jgi:chemotaxis protein MotB
LAVDLQQHQDLLKAAEPKLASLNSTVSERDQELDRLRRDQSRLQDVLRQEQERLKQEASEKQRLEQERAAKEAEIQQLTKTHEDLTKSLKDDIEKGNITIKQVRDQLTINMVDRVLFDSGKAEIKPAGIKVLKQVSDVLKHVADKQIRIEGHTDNVPIGPKIKDRFPTNWELSTARATSVIRYLIEDGGVDRTAISAGGYADTRPGASNETEDGRASNRRIEIVLYPKDLGAIVSQMAH